MKLSKEDREVLAHVVIDPDAWLAHAVKTFGEEQATIFLKQKVDRWRPEYLAKKDLPDYKNRVKRDAIEEGLWKADIVRMQKENLIQAKMREIATAELIKEGKLNGLAQPVWRFQG